MPRVHYGCAMLVMWATCAMLVMWATLLAYTIAMKVAGTPRRENFGEQAEGAQHLHRSLSPTSLTSLDDIDPPHARVDASAHVAHHLIAKSQLGPGEDS